MNELLEKLVLVSESRPEARAKPLWPAEVMAIHDSDAEDIGGGVAHWQALRYVETIEELTASVTTFNKNCESLPSTAKELISNTTYWVFDSNTNRFGASEFCAFHPMDFFSYQRLNEGRQAQRDSFGETSTREHIAELLDGEYRKDDALGQRLAAWIESLTFTKHHRKPSVHWVIISMSGEEKSTVDQTKTGPQAERLTAAHPTEQRLKSLFVDTNSTYKFLFFQGLLNILARHKSDEPLTTPIRDVTIRMMLAGRVIHSVHGFKLGSHDRLNRPLDELRKTLDPNDIKDLSDTALEETIKARLSIDKGFRDQAASLERYVPSLLLSPFFSKKELKGAKGDLKIKRLKKLSISHFDSHEPLYCFSEDGTALTLHPKWQAYLKTNDTIVRGWLYWSLLNYLERLNPHVSGLASKLFTPETSIHLAPAIEYDTLPEQTKALVDLLKNGKRQVILWGPPGTGKTRLARQAATFLLGAHCNDIEDGAEVSAALRDVSMRFRLIVFHPSYEYDQFIGGLTADTTDDGGIAYKTQPGIFVELCECATRDPNKAFVLVIDEINRGNLPRLLGELLYALEYRGETVTLSYRKGAARKQLVVPDNLYIVGTMNTADRSIGSIDAAIRRRFAFMECEPDARVIKHAWSGEAASYPDFVNSLVALLEYINQKLGTDQSLADLKVGHSYFLARDKVHMSQRWDYEILPLLKEYESLGAPNIFKGKPSLEEACEEAMKGAL